MAQTVLITGATSGIGRHAALYLAARGHHVIATGRGRKALRILEREAPSDTFDVVQLDVTKPRSIAAAVAAVDRLTGGRGVDVLINNAGYGQGGAVLDVDDGTLRAQFETNVFGTLAVTRAFAAKMVARGSGRVLNVSSIGGRLSMPISGVYNATKFAIECLSDALRMELAPLGVHVVIIEPGAIQSRFNDTMLASAEPLRDDSPWASAYATLESNFARFGPLAHGPEPVSRAMARAIESRRPRARYVAPWFYGVMLAVVTRLPTGLVDAVFRRGFGLAAPSRPSPSVRAAA